LIVRPAARLRARKRRTVRAPRLTVTSTRAGVLSRKRTSSGFGRAPRPPKQRAGERGVADRAAPGDRAERAAAGEAPAGAADERDVLDRPAASAEARGVDGAGRDAPTAHGRPAVPRERARAAREAGDEPLARDPPVQRLAEHLDGRRRAHREPQAPASGSVPQRHSEREPSSTGSPSAPKVAVPSAVVLQRWTSSSVTCGTVPMSA